MKTQGVYQPVKASPQVVPQKAIEIACANQRELDADKLRDYASKLDHRRWVVETECKFWARRQDVSHDCVAAMCQALDSTAAELCSTIDILETIAQAIHDGVAIEQVNLDRAWTPGQSRSRRRCWMS